MKIEKEYRGERNQRVTYIFHVPDTEENWGHYQSYEWNIEKKDCQFPFKNFMSRIWRSYWACRKGNK